MPDNASHSLVALRLSQLGKVVVTVLSALAYDVALQYI